MNTTHHEVQKKRKENEIVANHKIISQEKKVSKVPITVTITIQKI